MRNTTITHHILEIIPLPVFLVYSRLIDDPTVSENWLGPYLSSTILALLSTGILLWRKAPLNHCFIGINLYFLVGTAGILTGQVALNKLLGLLEASAMLACIVFMGIVSSAFSASGFVGVKTTDKRRQQQFSWLLVLVAIIATGISYLFRGNTLLSEFIPFITLFACMNFFRASLTRQNTC